MEKKTILLKLLTSINLRIVINAGAEIFISIIAFYCYSRKKESLKLLRGHQRIMKQPMKRLELYLIRTNFRVYYLQRKRL